jgi:hypothetical protein
MMKPLSDEILVAYADDELPAAERAVVERRLAYDAEARDRLAAFTSTGQWLARAYDDTLREPVPEALLAAIRTAGHEAAPTAAPQRTFWQRLRDPDWRSVWPAMGAVGGGIGVGLAAGIALLLAWPGQGPGGAPVAADVEGLVAQALETAAGGEPVRFELAEAALEVTPIGTVRTAAGEICREFSSALEVAGADPAVSHGVACRARDAAVWQTVARVELLPLAPDAPGFALASGAPQQVLDAVVDTLGEVEHLPADVERELLAAGWQ